MKKIIKLTALLLILVMSVGMVCGCTASQEDEDGIVLTHLTIGLPYGPDSEAAAGIMEMIGSIESETGYAYTEDAVVEIITVPEVGTKEYAAFIEKVANDKIDLFLAPSSPEIDTLIEQKKLVDNNAIVAKDSRFGEPLIPSAKSLSRESNRMSYSLPFTGSYQGLFINTDVFKEAEVEIPTDWASLNAAVTALKEKETVPFAAGFTDGAGYWLDEMILSEGGVAEHSAIPSKGVINSWARAVNDIKKFYDAGAFQSDVLSNTHDVAVQQFINKEAAMIICTSKDIATAIDATTVTYMPMPVTDTGIKEKDAFIGKSEYNFYFNAKSFAKNIDDTTAMSGKMAELISAYMASSEWYYDLFSIPGGFPFFDSVSDCMDTDVEVAAWEVISKSENADMPISNYLLAYDELETGLVRVLEGQVSVEDYLSSVTEAEVTARAEKKAQEKDKK